MEASYRIRAIYSFVRSADAGSFSAAAKTLGISSAAVSKNVALLEKDLGIRLLNRTTRSLMLTEEGARFLQHARNALNSLDAAIDDVVEERTEPKGKIRITASHALGQQILLPLLPELLDIYPDLRIEANFNDNLVDLVKDGYDLALRGGIIQNSSLISRPICPLNTVLVATNEYLQCHGAPSSIRELFSHRLIARRFLNGDINPWYFCDGNGSIESLDPSESAILTLSSPDSVLNAVLSHAGIGQVPVYLAMKYLADQRLKIVLYQQHHPGHYQLTLQYPHRSLVPPRISATVDFLLNKFSGIKELQASLEELAPFSHHE